MYLGYTLENLQKFFFVVNEKCIKKMKKMAYLDHQKNAGIVSTKYSRTSMSLCLKQGHFELMSVYHSASSGGIIGISFQVSLT